MKKTLIGAATAGLLISGTAFAEGPPASRDVVIKLPSLSDVEKSCVDQLKKVWSKPDNYDDTFRSMTLDTVYHRREGQANVVVFTGQAYNNFLKLDRATTVTCRVTEKPPFNVSFSIDR